MTDKKADVILIGGTVVTMNPDQPEAEAVAWRGNRIVYVGAAAGAQAYKGPQTRLIDAAGMIVYPGFVDAHAHLYSLGKLLNELNLTGTESLDQIQGMVREYAAEQPSDAWITGRGWDQNDWPVQEFPSLADLPDVPNPVYLRRIDGHAGWVNRRALELAGITAATPDPDGGKILRDANGRPTGILIDNAMNLVSAQMPEPTVEEVKQWIRDAVAACHETGLTGMHDAWTDEVSLQALRELEAEGELNFRVCCMLASEEKDLEFLNRQLANGPQRDPESLVRVGMLKLFADGALGSRGAALIEEYSDDPGNTGLVITDADSIATLTKRALAAGFQVCTHAIGDRGAREVLDGYEKALQAVPTEDHRLRIEHAQIIHPDDLPRFAELGVVPAMQPTHATSDMPWAEDRVGAERILGAYAWRSLLDAGCRIPLGSDAPVEDHDPLKGLYAAVTRQDAGGNPEGGWYPDQRLTMEEALRGFTLDAAWGAFQEEHLGSIEVGKLADLTVLDRDLRAVQVEDVLDASVRATVINGKVVFEGD